MLYNAFLVVMSQMASKKKARVIIPPHYLVIEALSKPNRWRISTHIFHCGQSPSPRIHDFLKSGEFLRWYGKGCYLKLDETAQSVYLMQEMKMPLGRYLPFRTCLRAFITAAEEWRETLHHCADNCSTINCNYC